MNSERQNCLVTIADSDEMIALRSVTFSSSSQARKANGSLGNSPPKRGLKNFLRKPKSASEVIDVRERQWGEVSQNSRRHSDSDFDAQTHSHARNVQLRLKVYARGTLDAKTAKREVLRARGSHGGRQGMHVQGASNVCTHNNLSSARIFLSTHVCPQGKIGTGTWRRIDEKAFSFAQQRKSIRKKYRSIW